jgi:hypothetical protein
LADLICEQNPYPDPRIQLSDRLTIAPALTSLRNELEKRAAASTSPYEPGGAGPGDAHKDGVAAEFDQNKTLDVPRLDAIKQNPELCEWWHFGGKAHRVVKSLRIPITWSYQGKEVQDYILIGYVGWETS